MTRVRHITGPRSLRPETDALLDEAFTRASGSPRIYGNRVRLLKDAIGNYPAWISAIESAQQWIHLETYILRDDPIGRRFADLLSERARAGVKVRLLYDWIGSLGRASRRFWRSMGESGVDIRRFNTPSLISPLGWINRDHRKMIAVDGRLAFVTGLCVGQSWIGSPERGIDPWRDMGVEIAGPALADIESAFNDSWSAAGQALPSSEMPRRNAIKPAGDIAVRIIASVPHIGGMYRLDQLAATLARRSIWLADAYFVGTTSYVQALCAAARAGVDVRLLLPGANDLPVMRALARAGLRPLLEAGVRVFEWNGSMMHAKTAVIDGRWARVGSTNLNLTSWMNNRELDVMIENERFASQMERSYVADLSRSTEIVLHDYRPRALAHGSSRVKGSSASRTAAGVIRIGHAVGAAIANRRELGPAETVILIWAIAILLAVAAVAAYWPRAAALPAAAICVWLSLSLLPQVFRLRSTPGLHRPHSPARTSVTARDRGPSPSS